MPERSRSPSGRRIAVCAAVRTFHTMLPHADAPPAAERAVTPPWSRPDDAVRQAQLDAMKRQATGLLALAGGVFVAARLSDLPSPRLGDGRATAEAPLARGLADRVPAPAL